MFAIGLDRDPAVFPRCRHPTSRSKTQAYNVPPPAIGCSQHGLLQEVGLAVYSYCDFDTFRIIHHNHYNMSCDNCKTGFAWEGKSTGKETTLGKNKAYVTGDNRNAAILIVCDIYGWTLPNIRILADHYAKEANGTVYVPDFFDGEVVDPEALSNPEKAKNFDLMAFLGRNSKEIRWPEIKASAQELKKQYRKVAAIGFCYGGWACFKLAAEPSLIDAISTAHPSLLDKAEIDAVKVPVQVLSPENDFAYTEELKAYTVETLPKTGVQWEYIYFPGLTHGFAARGDPKDKKQKDGLERAKRVAVNFFNEFLH